jgi:hypothetical protein
MIEAADHVMQLVLLKDPVNYQFINNGTGVLEKSEEEVLRLS